MHRRRPSFRGWSRSCSVRPERQPRRQPDRRVRPRRARNADTGRRRMHTGGDGGQLTGSVVDHTASQGALVYDSADGLLLAVNAGSNTDLGVRRLRRPSRAAPGDRLGRAVPGEHRLANGLVYVSTPRAAGRSRAISFSTSTSSRSRAGTARSVCRRAHAVKKHSSSAHPARSRSRRADRS